jgi:hypothetical protein
LGKLSHSLNEAAKLTCIKEIKIEIDTDEINTDAIMLRRRINQHRSKINHAQTKSTHTNAIMLRKIQKTQTNHAQKTTQMQSRNSDEIVLTF